MAPFKQFKDELEKLQSQGGTPDASIEQLKEEYAKQISEADELLREKQAQEREVRNQEVDNP